MTANRVVDYRKLWHIGVKGDTINLLATGARPVRKGQ